MPTMDDEQSWKGGVLAVVKPDGLFPLHGVLVAGVGPCVHLLHESEVNPKTLRLCEVERYASCEAMEADGWRAGP